MKKFKIVIAGEHFGPTCLAYYKIGAESIEDAVEYAKNLLIEENPDVDILHFEYRIMP